MLSPTDTKSALLQVRIDPSTKFLVRAAAADADEPYSVWVRRALRAAARRAIVGEVQLNGRPWSR